MFFKPTVQIFCLTDIKFVRGFAAEDINGEHGENDWLPE